MKNCSKNISTPKFFSKGILTILKRVHPSFKHHPPISPPPPKVEKAPTLIRGFVYTKRRKPTCFNKYYLCLPASTKMSLIS